MSDTSNDVPAGPVRPLRSDAARNHQAVLAAARALYAESGLGVGFDEIARRAGVGVGTVYRRFPDRDSLVSALFEDRFAAVDALVGRAIETRDAWQGLRIFVLEAVEMFAEDRGLREIAFESETRFPGLADQRGRLALLVGRVADRAHQAGVLRLDCRAQDLASIVAMLSGLTAPSVRGPARDDDDAVARCAEFVLDGIRARRYSSGAHSVLLVRLVPRPAAGSPARRRRSRS